jgi:hypothetical protein
MLVEHMRLLLQARSRAVRAALLACAVVAVALGAGTARADEAPFVMLELEQCEQLQEKEVRRVFAAELGTRAADAPGKDVTQVTVFCQGTHVRVVVADPLTQKTVQRSFDIALSEPHGRSRLVAVAATELVVASWTELELNPHPKVVPAGPPPDAAATLAARQLARERVVPYEPSVRHWYDADTPPARRFRLMATASMRQFFEHEGTLWGGGVRIGEERFHFLGWAADALIEQGTLKLPGRHYDVTNVSTAAWLMLAKTIGFATMRAGAGLRLGFVSSSPLGASSSGLTERGSATIAPWGWPLGVASFTFAVGRYVVLDLAGECGYAVVPVEGGGATVTGSWFSGQLGLGFVLPSAESVGRAEAEADASYSEQAGEEVE